MSRGLRAFQIDEYLTKKIIQDLVIECASSTQAVIKDGSIAGADDGSVIMEAASDITVDITSSGVNGLDTGSEAADTWYYIFMIYNPSSGLVRGLLSASATSPTMPSGYTKKRLVGAVRNDGSSNFRQFLQTGAVVNHALVSIVNAVSAFVPISVDLSSVMPVNALRSILWVQCRVTASTTPIGLTEAANISWISGVTELTAPAVNNAAGWRWRTAVQSELCVPSSRVVYYNTTNNGSGAANVIGYVHTMGFVLNL